ncbi:MBL fold metallo-hydrolase [Alkalihalobacillus pseudalcaliphilus]|uniref:MBL fold metallo-hydrolase n=1 Tax=Alkalihalobacillus pseudalcaliphilus TaxID=79884 RepID=UPI00064DBB62|nr:MBL fold metallo-hydrolase [Alkalihalobacillus pseudalcaliphilus]KMK75600.1 hydrolase glyoxylase [Alkalihalobacillus pseudalcaliphilus]
MLNKWNEHIYYLSHDEKQERPVLGLVCGEKYSLIIDGGNSPQHAQEFLREIEKLSIPPIRYLVITHAHWDHFLGANEYDATIIMNRRTHQKWKKWQLDSLTDASLQQLVDQQLINEYAMKAIQENLINDPLFQLRDPDIIFDETLKIDLGHKICQIDTVSSTHTNDSTIVYLEDDELIFLGDCAYGKTRNSLFHYEQQMLNPMIEDIQKYQAKYFLLGHESICDLAEMDLYWKELQIANKAVKSTSLEEAMIHFEKEFKRKANENETFFIQAFVNDQILKQH